VTGLRRPRSGRFRGPARSVARARGGI